MYIEAPVHVSQGAYCEDWSSLQLLCWPLVRGSGLPYSSQAAVTSAPCICLGLPVCCQRNRDPLTRLLRWPLKPRNDKRIWNARWYAVHSLARPPNCSVLLRTTLYLTPKNICSLVVSALYVLIAVEYLSLSKTVMQRRL